MAFLRCVPNRISPPQGRETDLPFLAAAVGEEGIDAVWSKIVKAVALADGALIKTGAVHCAKVSCSPGDSNSW